MQQVKRADAPHGQRQIRIQQIEINAGPAGIVEDLLDGIRSGEYRPSTVSRKP